MAEITFLPYKLFKNLKHLMKYRGLNIDETVFNVTSEEFMRNFEYNGYVKITTSLNKGLTIRPYYIFIIDSNNTKILKGAKEFINWLNKQIDVKIPANLLIFTENSLSTILQKKIDNDEFENLVIDNPKFDVLRMNIPNHISFPSCKIVLEENVESILAEINQNKKNLPKIKKSDTMAIWIGAEPGDLIEIIRKSETCGKEKIYRLVINK